MYLAAVHSVSAGCAAVAVCKHSDKEHMHGAESHCCYQHSLTSPSFALQPRVSLQEGVIGVSAEKNEKVFILFQFATQWLIVVGGGCGSVLVVKGQVQG